MKTAEQIISFARQMDIGNHLQDLIAERTLRFLQEGCRTRMDHLHLRSTGFLRGLPPKPDRQR
jgi:hypothetical protein